MSVIETSISLYNKTLLDRIVPETMLCWQRVVLANALAHNGKEWTDLFAQHNSGTYNNGVWARVCVRARVGVCPGVSRFVCARLCSQASVVSVAFLSCI